MKKIFRLTIVCVLSALILLSSACTPKSTSLGYADTTSPLPAFTRGVHVFDTPAFENPTEEDYIVRNGEFQYKIMVPAQQSSLEAVAKQEFSRLLKRALGQAPVFITDASVSAYDENARYISIGATNYLDKAGIVHGEAEALALKGNGSKIISKGRNIFILGGHLNGIVYGVYNFFKICFNFEQYARNCIQMDTTVRNLPCMNFNVTDIPDVDESTYSSYGPIKNSAATDTDVIALSNENVSGADAISDISQQAYRFNAKTNLNQMCIQSHGEGHEGDTTSDAHNVLNIWSTKKPGVEGAWYAQSGYQMCWTAHGDAESRQRMIDFGVAEMIKDLQRYPVSKHPYKNYVYLGQEDNGGNCLCEFCVAEAERDGSAAGMEIRVGNEIIRRLKEWMDEKDENGNYVNAEYRRPNFKLVIMAYGTSRTAPATYDEDLGKYVVNPGCEMSEDVIIQIVAQSSPNHPIYHRANYDAFVQQKAWLDIAPGCWVWNHVFHHYNLPYFCDIPTCFSNERFQWWAESNASHLFNELGGGKYSQHWYDMYFYIFTKLSWDSTIPMSELIENYCKAYYGPAAETMLELFYKQQHYEQLICEQTYIDYGRYWPQGNQFWTEEDYPYPVIKDFIGYIDEALEEIKIVLDSDRPDMYEVYKERLDLFSVSLIYMIQDIYSSQAFKPYSNEEWIGYRNRAIEVLETHSMSKGKGALTADSFRTT
ncbi:MAG: DUF4838 domain-containing protein [Clostridia bacterium]|nr:DUF4838 domain-containing protein [Clostridia bacterium]